ncbi:MAG: hypothetical protein ACRBBK_08785 [Paracoccaceae bacterium]
MAQFFLGYKGGEKPATPEAGKAMMAEWQAWVGELGDALVVAQQPLMGSKTLTSSGVEDGQGPDPLSGYSILEAEDMEAALKIAKTCPFLKMNTARLQISQLMGM